MSIRPWTLLSSLDEKTSDEMKFSRGFLRGKPAEWFPQLATQWLPLFHQLEAGLDSGKKSAPKLIFATPRLGFPARLQRLCEIEVDGEKALVGLDDHAVDCLTALIAPALPEVSGDVFLEYLERRLCATLQTAWVDDEPMLVQYAVQEGAEGLQCVGSVQLRLQFSDLMFDIWFGCGPGLIHRLDLASRKRLRESGIADHSDQIKTISVELAELWVPPALLIDYMRSGTTIDLERDSSADVRLLLDGQPWAMGTLCLCDDQLAVQVEELGIQPNASVEGSTRVSILLSQTQIDLSALPEYAQAGALLALDIDDPNAAQIVIGGETVATASIGELEGGLAVQVNTMG